MIVKRCSKDYDKGHFPQHGYTEISFDGRIMRFESYGPFNAELVEAVERAMRDLLRECPPQGPYYELNRLHGSALFSIEVLPAMRKLLAGLARDGLISNGVAMVAQDDVEGFRLMLPPYAATYAAQGKQVRVFNTYAEAEAWVEAQLAAQ